MRSLARLPGLALALLAVLWPGGPILADPASEFAAPPIGTRLTYSDFGCSVDGAWDLTLACTTSHSGSVGPGRIAIVGHSIVEGRVVPVGFMRALHSANIQVKSITLAPDARPALAAMWPLAVGVGARFEVEVQITHQTSGWYGQDKKCNCTAQATSYVVATDVLDLSGREVTVYVIETTTGALRIPGAGLAALKWTFWYAPELGAPVRARTEWIQGPAKGGSAESELWHYDAPTT